MSVGERIRKLRKARGWTQDELAEHSDMNGRHLRSQQALANLVPDPELLQQFQVLSRMDEEDRNAVKRVLAAMVMRGQMQKMLVGQSS